MYPRIWLIVGVLLHMGPKIVLKNMPTMITPVANSEPLLMGCLATMQPELTIIRLNTRTRSVSGAESASGASA